ncbi:fimbrial chaperone [Salmonella enterica subsp. enterica serovar Bredeney]
MNKTAKSVLGMMVSLVMCGQAMAAFTLNSTRYIYNEGQKNTTVEVTNNADKTYGGQVWVNNSTEGDSKVYMVGQPPFFKVAPKEKQLIRIMNVDSSLPKDRESLFWLNVQEVPPKPENTEGNVLAIAMNTKVKLFYRPKGLEAGRDNAETRLQVEQRGNGTWLKNPTPYYFAVVEVKSNGKDVKLSDKNRSQLAQFPPFSEVPLGSTVSGKISVQAVNDWGGMQDYDIQQ